MIRCPRCGTYLNDGVSFCLNCGCKIERSGDKRNNMVMFIIIVILVVLAAVLGTVVIMKTGGTGQKQNNDGDAGITVEVTETPKAAEAAEEPEMPTPEVIIVTPEPYAGTVSANDAVVKYMYVTNCDDWISLRTSPSTSASTAARIPLGANVGYIEPASNGFYKVNYDGQTGYALAAYLTDSSSNITSSNKKTTGSGDVKKTMYVVNCDEWISLRTSPSTNASTAARIPLGANVGYIESSDNGFYKVNYNGQTGYALASYLSDSKPSVSTNAAQSSGTRSMTVVNCDEWISLRSSPSTSASTITKIPLGAAVTFISSADNGFCKISYNGQTGYALSQYLR